MEHNRGLEKSTQIEETQRQIIAYVVSNSAMEELISEGLQPEHFGKYKNFVKIMFDLHNNGVLVSYNALSSKFEGKDFIKVINLLECELDFFFRNNFSYFCTLVKNEYNKHEFNKLLLESLHNINSLDLSEEITKYTTFESKVNSVSSIKKLDSLEEKMINLLSSPKSKGLKTGLKSFDIPSGGAKEGKLIVLAARPGMGKTAYMLCLLEGLLEQGINCGFISLEMTEEEIIERLICMQNFDNNNIRKELHVKDEQVKAEYLSNLKAVCSLPLFIDEDSGINANKIKQKLYSLHSKGCKVVAIDYLQLISLTGRKTTTEEIGEITRMLKSLAKKLDMTIFLLSQLSREVEKRKDKLPNLSDLRSSGDIEQDADMVIFLFRPAYYIDKGALDVDFVYNQLDLKQDQTAVIIDKNRGGQTCRQICYFEGKHYRFFE